jgi:hypothetical protein
MKRRLAVILIGIAGLAAMAQTCIVTHESLTEIDGNDAFAGEMENRSGVNILAHKFRIAFLNSNGAVVETVTVDGCLRSLQHGASNFFAATSRLPAASTSIGLARVANLAEDPAFKVGTVEDSNFTLTDVTAERDDGTLTVEGTITNEDNEELMDPVACVVVWNDENRVVTTGKSGVLADLAEGASVDFSFEIEVPDDVELVDTVDVWVDGLDGNVPVEPVGNQDVGVTVVPDEATATPTATATATATATPEP